MLVPMCARGCVGRREVTCLPRPSSWLKRNCCEWETLRLKPSLVSRAKACGRLEGRSELACLDMQPVSGV